MNIDDLYGKKLWSFFGGLYEKSDLYMKRMDVGDYDINHEIFLMIEFLFKAYIGFVCMNVFSDLEDLMSDDSEDDLEDEENM